MTSLINFLNFLFENYAEVYYDFLYHSFHETFNIILIEYYCATFGYDGHNEPDGFSSKIVYYSLDYIVNKFGYFFNEANLILFEDDAKLSPDVRRRRYKFYFMFVISGLISFANQQAINDIRAVQVAIIIIFILIYIW